MDIQKYKPTERFSDRAEKYARYRPTYPAKIIEIMSDEYHLTPDCSIADIGSGTGIFSRLLLESGYRVVAIEPNREMRIYAEKDLSEFHRFESVCGSAEKTTLADSSIDAITMAQAFHWCDIELTITEFYRILKPGAPLFLIWNERKVDNNRFQMRYEKAIVKFCQDYKDINHANFSRDRINSIFPEKRIDEYHFENRQVFDLESLIGRLESSSYCPDKEDNNYSPLMESVRNLFEKYHSGGKITIEYDCVMYCIE